MAFKLKDNEEKPSFDHRWLYVAAVFVVAVLVIAVSLGTFYYAYAQKIYPGVTVGDIALGGKSKAEALAILERAGSQAQQRGIVYFTAKKRAVVEPINITAGDPDLARPILIYDWSKTIDEAYGYGRNGTVVTDFLNQVRSLIASRNIKAQFVLDREELQSILKENFGAEEDPPRDAGLEIDGTRVTITPEKSGYLLNYQKAIDETARQAAALRFSDIMLELHFAEPEIKKSETASAQNSIDRVQTIESIRLNDGGRSWVIEQETFIPWLEFQRLENSVVVGVNKEKTIEHLKTIAAEIDVPVQDAKFRLENQRVVEFQPSQDGRATDLEKSYEVLNTAVVTGNLDNIQLVINITKSEVKNDDLNNLGIKELLGRGHSNFAGSPVNRRHNIKVGSDSLNGILIKPGEEFSLLDALGEIDGENGYLKELVIKGNRTVPEYGGGLCQIGSTTFRAALRSGLPITQRKNHSYRVVYYEPAGMDATIYDPAPDMRFLNDTGHHILFIARMEKDDLYFEFYGTHDGRKVTIAPDPPSIYNVVSPGPARMIESEELAPGQKKKVESAHPGADTYFKYTVEYPNGEIKEQEFYSHYVAWPEVWLVGKEPDTPTATSTEETEEAQTPSPTPTP